MRTSASLRLLAMGLTVAGVSLLTACGGDAPAPTATAPTTPAAAPAPAAPEPAAPAATTAAADPHKIMTELGCAACHKTDAKLANKIMEGGSGVWGPVAMTPNKNNPAVTPEKVDIMVDWILAGAK